jgi:hypothetical protein
MAKTSKSKRDENSKESPGKTDGSKKGSAKKPGSTKATAAKKAGNQMREAVATAFKGDCLGLERAAEIVLSCIAGAHQLKETLEEAGLISPDLRKTFKECVFQKVNETCKIKDSGIPNGPTVKLRDVAIAISDNAEKP